MRTLNLAFVVAFAIWSVPALATERGNLGAVALDPQDGGTTGGQKGFPSGPGPIEHQVVPAAAFAGDGYLDADTYRFWFSTGSIEGNGITGYGCVMAPVHLPGDAYILQLSAALWDYDPAEAVGVTLWRVDTYLGTADVMATVATLGDALAIQIPWQDTVAFPAVRLPRYSYYLTTCLSNGDQRVYAVWVDYSPALFMDGFESGYTDYWSATQP
jgi:hypothetical protein